MAADLVNGEDLFGNSNSSLLGFLKEALQVLRLLKIKIKLVFVHNVPNSYKVHCNHFLPNEKDEI